MAKIFFLTITLFSIFIMPMIFAITANSSDYSVSRFGTGIQATNLTSADLTGRAISLANAGTRAAENDVHTVNIGFWGNTTYYRSVSITSYSISLDSAVVGSTIGLYISALNYQSLWAKIISPNNQEQIITLTNNQYVYYVPSPSVVGRYNVTFYANSSTGAIASAVDSFDFTEQVTTPTTTPSGGSGGTTTIIEKCTYNWDCTSWSLCSEGKQKRECKNIGTCNGTESKPIEIRNCSDALFDVVIKFKEIELTKNDTLKFSIDLIETKGVEKIDVYIRYSIIDSKNNEIFSQLETRAVQKELIFEKEIDEIKLQNGEYLLRVDILYGKLQVAFAEQRFNIKDRVIELEGPGLGRIYYIILLFVLGLGIFIFILLLIFIIIKRFKRRKKKLIEQDLDIGTRLIAEGKTNDAGLIYKNLKRIYNPKEDSNREIYNKIIGFYNQILKSKPLAVFMMVIGAMIIFLSSSRSNITGGAIGIEETKTMNWVFILIILFVLALSITFRKKLAFIYKKINFNKYPKNSICGLINKKVYSESGDYIGKINDIILGENKIESLKIKVNKRHKFKSNGVIINYKQVKSAGKIIIINEKVYEHLINNN